MCSLGTQIWAACRLQGQPVALSLTSRVDDPGRESGSISRGSPPRDRQLLNLLCRNLLLTAAAAASNPATATAIATAAATAPSTATATAAAAAAGGGGAAAAARACARRAWDRLRCTLGVSGENDVGVGRGKKVVKECRGVHFLLDKPDEL